MHTYETTMQVKLVVNTEETLGEDKLHEAFHSLLLGWVSDGMAATDYYPDQLMEILETDIHSFSVHLDCKEWPNE